MGFFILALLLLLSFSTYNSFSANKKELSQNYLAPSVSQSVKGFFVILIFFSHFNSYVHYSRAIDISLLSFCNFWGQLIVVPFFLYSGYGVYESIKKKGGEYINVFPKKRILKILFHFNLALVPFLILNSILGIHHDLKTILLSLIAWEDIGNSNWFIFAILSTYLFTYCSFKLNKKHFYAIITTTILTASYIATLYWLKKDEPWWYNTIICYPIGMFYSYFKTSIEKRFLITTRRILFLSIFILAGFIACFIYQDVFVTITFQIRTFFFVVLLIIWTRLFPFTNSILKWFGGYVFEIYMLQRIPMIFFEQLKINDYIYHYFAICALCTILLSILFKQATSFLDSKLKIN